MATERAILAGGCFWGAQDLLRKYPGVISSRVGYTSEAAFSRAFKRHYGVTPGVARQGGAAALRLERPRSTAAQ